MIQFKLWDLQALLLSSSTQPSIQHASSGQYVTSGVENPSHVENVMQEIWNAIVSSQNPLICAKDTSNILTEKPVIAHYDRPRIGQVTAIFEVRSRHDTSVLMIAEYLDSPLQG